MKIFLSYRFTGEDPQELHTVLGNIIKVLEAQEHQVFCSLFLENLFREQNMSTDEIYEYCLEKQKESDIFLAFVKSEHPSKGMEKESALAAELQQKYFLLIQEGLSFPHFRDLAEKIIEYKTLSDISSLLEKNKI